MFLDQLHYQHGIGGWTGGHSKLSLHPHQQPLQPALLLLPLALVDPSSPPLHTWRHLPPRYTRYPFIFQVCLKRYLGRVGFGGFSLKRISSLNGCRRNLVHKKAISKSYTLEQVQLTSGECFMLLKVLSSLTSDFDPRKIKKVNQQFSLFILLQVPN